MMDKKEQGSPQTSDLPLLFLCLPSQNEAKTQKVGSAQKKTCHSTNQCLQPKHAATKDMGKTIVLPGRLVGVRSVTLEKKGALFGAWTIFSGAATTKKGKIIGATQPLSLFVAGTNF